MVSGHFRFLLTATLFSPVLLLFCINDVLHRRVFCTKPVIDKNIPVIIWVFFAIALLLAFLCIFIVKRAIKNILPGPLRVKTYTRRNQDTLSFVLIFLLPFVNISDVITTEQYIIYFLIFLIITVVMSDISAYQYNLVMRIFGYRFYIIKDEDDIECLLITTKPLRTPNIERDAIQLYEDVYIAVNEGEYD